MIWVSIKWRQIKILLTFWNTLYIRFSLQTNVFQLKITVIKHKIYVFSTTNLRFQAKYGVRAICVNEITYVVVRIKCIILNKYVNQSAKRLNVEVYC